MECPQEAMDQILLRLQNLPTENASTIPKETKLPPEVGEAGTTGFSSQFVGLDHSYGGSNVAESGTVDIYG